MQTAQLRLMPPPPHSHALPLSQPSPGSGDQALFTLEVGFPGAGAEEVGASLSSGSELEHSNYTGGFMSLCL